MKIITFLLFTSFQFLSITSLFAEEKIVRKVDFDGYRDTLCFENDSAEFRGVLGGLANKTGACQGMVGLVAAVRNHIEFDANAVKSDDKASYRQIKAALMCEKRSCGGKKFLLAGYSNLRDFCEASLNNKEFLKKRAVNINAFIGVTDIFLAHFRSFFLTNSLRVKDKEDLVLKTIESMFERLERNKTSLMLYKNHVVLVTKIQKVLIEGLINRVEITYYDPNFFYYPRLWVTQFKNGKPDLGESLKADEELIWDITPEAPSFKTW